MVHAKYGAVTGPGSNDSTGDDQRPPPFQPDNDDTAMSAEYRSQPRPGKRRRWSLAAAGALVFGAAVLGVTVSSHLKNSAVTTADGLGSGTASLVKSIDAGAAAAAPSTGRDQLSATPAGTPAAGDIPPLSFTALNFYHVRDGRPALDYPLLKDFKLLEPHRETTLTVASPREDYEYLWEIRSANTRADGAASGGGPEAADESDPEPYVTATGAEAVVIVTVLDRNVITLKEVDSMGTVARQLDEVVVVKYVRREIRTLTDEERNELFDAMYELWAVRVDGGNGKDLYGEDYSDIYAIQRMHFQAAMDSSCDHYHDGVNFLTSHTIISNTFEYSMQLVNPKLTLPYWDWTIEEYESQKTGHVSDAGGLMIESPLFQETWFGSADPDDYKVKDGRWANTEIPFVYEGNPGHLLADVYGRLRSGFNVNTSPTLVRGLGKRCNGYVTDLCPWPSCTEHYDMVTQHPDFYSWVWDGQCNPHGNVHQWIAGVLNCEETIDRVSSLVGLDNALNLGFANFDTRKKLWVNGWFRCESSSAETGESLEDVYAAGKCGCLDYDLTEGDDWETIYYNSSIAFDHVLGDDYDDKTKRAVVIEACSSTIYLGDHSHAGSSLDPTFWPMHPTMERLFMFSVLTETTTDLSWPDESNENFQLFSLHGDQCLGHQGSDVFPYGFDSPGFEIKTGIRGNVDTGNTMTNRQVLHALDIRTVDALPYVYDTFAWDHCTEIGLDFDDAWD